MGPPLFQTAQKAVGMPPEPSSTSKPSLRSRSTYQAADLYSRQAGSWKSQIVLCQLESCSSFSATQSSAVCFSSVMLVMLRIPELDELGPTQRPGTVN